MSITYTRHQDMHTKPQKVYINNEQPKSIDDATPEEWDALSFETGNVEPKLGPYAEYRLNGGCQSCEE